MKLLERLLRSLGFGRTSIPIKPEMMPPLEELAAQEGKTVVRVAQEMLFRAVAESNAAAANLSLWQELTPREQQTAALACLGYTNREIAERMVISANTVKSHMRSILHKFSINSKAELRTVLAGWDFNSWIEEQNLG